MLAFLGKNRAISFLLLIVLLTACGSRSPEEWARSLNDKRNSEENDWAFRGFSHYQMTVELYYRCEQTIVSENGVSSLLEDSCQDGTIRDINFLFDWIESKTNYYLEHPTCGPNGCECDGPINIEVDYHLGDAYPMILMERTFPEYRERSWLDGLSRTGPVCTMMGFLGEIYYVTSFIPED